VNHTQYDPNWLRRLWRDLLEPMFLDIALGVAVMLTIFILVLGIF
jgi:hypothetical protein